MAGDRARLLWRDLHTCDRDVGRASFRHDHRSVKKHKEGEHSDSPCASQNGDWPYPPSYVCFFPAIWLSPIGSNARSHSASCDEGQRPFNVHTGPILQHATDGERTIDGPKVRIALPRQHREATGGNGQEKIKRGISLKDQVNQPSVRSLTGTQELQDARAVQS
jgi:hypothetical protein